VLLTFLSLGMRDKFFWLSQFVLAQARPDRRCFAAEKCCDEGGRTSCIDLTLESQQNGFLSPLFSGVVVVLFFVILVTRKNPGIQVLFKNPNAPWPKPNQPRKRGVVPGGFRGNLVIKPAARFTPQALAGFLERQKPQGGGGVFRHGVSPV
jgi:hypothetical protein